MQSNEEKTHQKWVKWIEEMNKHVKYDVKFYQLKNIYEKSLENPRTHPNQEGVGNLDITITYIYNYDGGVIGQGGVYNVVENTHYGDGVDVKDEDEHYMSSEKDMKRRQIIKDVINERNGVRIGLYTKQVDGHPSFYVISTENEDPVYYAKVETGLYDSDEYCLYYSIRYDISHETYYVLSGMSQWTDDIFSEIFMPPCPSNSDEIDELRYTREYLGGVDLDLIYNDIQHLPNRSFNTLKNIANKYGLSYTHIKAISDKKL